MAQILSAALASNHAKEKAETKAYGNGGEGVAPNSVACGVVLIIGEVRNAVAQIAEVILYRSCVRISALSRCQATLDEEEATDQALTKMAETAVNQQAEAA
jgi:hypothetical protein